MKFLSVLILVLAPHLALAKDLPEATVEGNYQADRDPSESPLTIELRKGSISGKVGETALRGEYIIKDDFVTLMFDRVKCKVQYKEGLGLDLMPAAGKRPALCNKLFKKVSK